jgi:hypothetical protein
VLRLDSKMSAKNSDYSGLSRSSKSFEIHGNRYLLELSSLLIGLQSYEALNDETCA